VILAERPARLPELRGIIRRSLLVLPDGRTDDVTDVVWLQGLSLYVDLRRPPGPPVTATCRDGLDRAAVDQLARQDAFAGRCEQVGVVTVWHRDLDLQPPASTPDAGRLTWRDGLVVEDGVLSLYVEHWIPDVAAPRSPAWGLRLRDGSTSGLLIRVGDRFGYARGRAVPLTGEALGDGLAGLVAAAPTLRAAQGLVDCEVSLGRVTTDGAWAIEASTLPYREGADLAAIRTGDALLTHDVRPDGSSVVRRWQIVESEGESRWR
jgi:hypothetical protein